jgi:hypothetical protein
VQGAQAQDEEHHPGRQDEQTACSSVVLSVVLSYHQTSSYSMMMVEALNHM